MNDNDNITICRVRRPEAQQARGVVIAIDVIRAFTVAAYAFAGGARCMELVRTVEEAHALRERDPDALLAGEIGGRLIPGFDFNNSPTLMASRDVRDRLIIQRTGAGTQGAVSAVNASHILLCSLVNARATAAYARQLATSSEAGGIITLLPTASNANANTGLDWNEDEVCADYLEALLTNPEQAETILTKGIDHLQSENRFTWFEPGSFDAPYEDIAAILAVDRFAFAMQGTHKQWRDITYVEVHRRLA
jgi:2-phosphosulfolactate phosphatase